MENSGALTRLEEVRFSLDRCIIESWRDAYVLGRPLSASALTPFPGSMKHNHLAIALAVVANQVVGFVWYSPLLFFDLWSSGFRMEPDLPFKEGFGPFFVALGTALVAAYVLSWIVVRQDIRTGLRGLELGALLAVGFVITSTWLHYSFARLPFSVVAIDGGFSLVSLSLIGYIIGAWRKDTSGAGAAE